ncbi:MAG: hypothetical protein WCE80_12665 [Acidimicrobiia bacterium]
MTGDGPAGGRTKGQILGAAVSGLLIGLAGGAALGAGLPVDSLLAGALTGGLVMALVSGWADANRISAQPQPLWVRVLASVCAAAAIGWLLESLLPDWPLVVVGGIVGVAAGTLGFRVGKLALGLAIGLVVGAGFEYFTDGYGWSVVAAVTVLAHRFAAGALYRGREQVRFLAESAADEDVPFVVPLVEWQGYVGIDYLKRYASRIGATFAHSPPDIGIVESFDLFAGPGFDPDLVHPLIREFYEHTSRFSLTIVPKWRAWMRLPYLIYRETVAKPLGQANAPFHVEEVQRGVVSWIDTIDVDDDGVPDFRAWVRAYEGSNEPLYVGIYTVVRERDTAYVSVGFPLPAGSFTATLLPTHVRGDGLLLSSRKGEFQGHYLSVVDRDTEEISVAKLESLDEEIEVYVVDGELFTDHRFFLGGIEFMMLHYDITRH